MALLEAYGDAFQAAVREVYRRCVVSRHPEPWFVAAKGTKPPSGVRPGLNARGWSQREATAIHTTAVAAQEAAVEATKLALARASQDLEVVDEKLASTKRSHKHSHKRHGLSRRHNKLSSQVERLATRLASKDVRVCFGGKKLALAGNDPVPHGYEGRSQWRERWDRVRGGGFVAFGDSESVCGNYSARAVLSDDGKSDVVMLRVPAFLRHMNDGEEWAKIPVVGFSYNRSLLSRAMSPDLAGLVAKTGKRDKQQAAYEAGATEEKPAKTLPRLCCSSPVTLRFYWDEAKGAWYVQATFDRPDVPTGRRHSYVLGADLNPDHIAWCLANRDGNPVRWGRIDIDLSGTADQNRDSLGVAVKELTGVAKSHGAAIAVETLDFTRARAQFRYRSRRLKRLLSSFAYNKFFEVLSSRCAREGLGLVPVGPAWTSVLGQANYAAVYGVSVDQGAACVIARRALGLGTAVRPQVSRQIPGRGDGARASLRTRAGLKLLASSLPKRSSTWDPSGLCARRHLACSADGPSLGPRPPGKGATAPAPSSPSGPTAAQMPRASRSHGPVPLGDTPHGLRTLGEVKAQVGQP